MDNDLKILLVKRNIEPFKDFWALPGGFVRIDESLEDAAKRELAEETGVKDVYLEQLYTFGNPKRDPRTRVITVAYYALISTEDINLRAATDVSDVKWFSMKNIPKVAFDHDEIINYALKRLRYKLEYTAVGFELLPQLFTLTDLQRLYEVILDEKLDKRNFRKKITSLGIVEETEKYKKGHHRPALLYKFKKIKNPEKFKKTGFEF